MAKEEKEKINLSDEKLKIEIQDLLKPWYKKLDFWKILIPTIAVIISLYFTFGKGIVDTQKEKLSIQKEQLKLEILQFKLEKGTVIEDINELKKELTTKESQLDSLNESVELLNLKNGSYLNQIGQSKKQIQIIKKQKEADLKSISKERNLDKEFLRKKLFEQYSIAKNNAEKVDKYKNKVSFLRAELKKVNAEKEFLKTKTNLTFSDSLDLSALKSKTEMEILRESSENISADVKKIRERYEKAVERIDNDSISIDDAVRELDLWFYRNEHDKKRKTKEN